MGAPAPYYPRKIHKAYNNSEQYSDACDIIFFSQKRGEKFQQSVVVGTLEKHEIRVKKVIQRHSGDTRRYDE